MDAVNNNYSQFAANFASQAQQAQQASQTNAASSLGSVDQSQAVSSGSQVRLTESTDKMSYVASHPQLAESANLTAEESSELLQSTSEKLNSAETTCRGSSVMFDIYAILALIQETAQEMRNAQRDLRSAENQSIQSSIMAQADMQRTAAVTQLVTGCVTAGISLAMLGVSAYGMGKEISQTSQRQNAAGLDVMKQQENLLACSDNPKAASANFEGVKSMTPESIKTEVDAKMNASPAGSEAKIADCKAQCEAAGGEVTAAKRDFNAAQEKLRNCEPGSPEYASANKELIAANDKLDAAQVKLDGANQALGDAMTEAAAPEGADKVAQMGGVVDQYQSEFDAVSTRASYELEQTGKVSPETAQELKTAGQKLTYARASQVNFAAKSGGIATKSMSAAYQDVSARTASIEQNTAKGTAKQQHASVVYQTMGQSAQMVGRLGESIGQGITGIMNSEATRLQADQKASEEELDQIKDLFSSSQQLIQQSLQLFQSVVSKESQSIEEIIGGIRA